MPLDVQNNMSNQCFQFRGNCVGTSLVRIRRVTCISFQPGIDPSEGSDTDICAVCALLRFLGHFLSPCNGVILICRFAFFAAL